MLSIRVTPVQYNNNKPLTKPIVEYVSDCKCFPPAIKAMESYFLPTRMLYQPNT